jgi:heme exporter protein C
VQPDSIAPWPTAAERPGRTKAPDAPGLALAVLGALAMLAALAMVFLYAPRERTMGDVQRIFYFHVAAAWVGFAAFAVTCVASVAYLARRDARHDRLAHSSGEVGLAFMAMAVVTGSLWARPVWGVYWTWEPRLTISAVQLGVYLAYAMVRGLVEDPERGARFAAVYGILAFVTVPLSWFAIRWWRTIHPDIVTGGGGMGLTPPMVQTLLAAIVAFSILYLALVRARVRLEASAERLARLRLAVEEREEEMGRGR